MRMRLPDLALATFRAEALRLRLAFRRQGVRVALVLLAVVLGLYALAMLHIAAIGFLSRLVPPGFGALIVAGADVLLVLLCLVIAFRGGPSEAEQEASTLATTARAALAEEATWMLVLPPLLRRLRTQEVRSVLTAVLRLLRRRA